MRKTPKVIITSATTGAMHMPCMSPFLPVTVEQIIEDSVKAAEAGASIVHLHARDPETGMPSTDPKIYEKYAVGIKARSDVIINLTTGQPALGTPDEVLNKRLEAPLALAPEITSFKMGPMKPAPWALYERFKDQIKHPWEHMFFVGSKSSSMLNPYSFMERLAKELGEDRGVKFEFECFDIGHLYTLKFIADRGWVKPPFFIQSVFGFLGGLQSQAKHLVHFRETADALFGDDYIWSVLAAGKDQIRMTAMTGAMGGNVRVGMEDSLWYGKGQPATSSAQQVGRIRRILTELDLEIATPAEARQILGTKGADKVNF